MKPIAIFYHCLFEMCETPTLQEPVDSYFNRQSEVRENAINIVREQMALLKSTGLLDASSEFIVGINGGNTSREIASLIIPSKARVVMHGLKCRNECRTIRLLEDWLPGHEDWYVLYFHAKGCTHPAGDPMRLAWRRCMEKTVIKNWRQCVANLDEGYEAVGTHWMTPPKTPPGQFIFAGSMWWAKASFLQILPSIMERDRIKMSGIDSIESRYEAEVWIGNGQRPPKIKDYCPNWNPGKDHVA